MAKIRKYGVPILCDLSAVSDHISSMRAERLKPYGISDWDAALLVALDKLIKEKKYPAFVSLTDLKKEMSASLSYVSRAVSRLMLKDVLTQSIDFGDRRWRYIEVTGKIDPAEIRKIDEDLEAEAFKDFTDEEKAEFARLLGKINAV